MPDGDARDPTNCKVGRLVTEYDLDGAGDTLVAKWTDEDPASLRDLADWFNRRLVAAALRDAGRNPVAADVAATHGVLAGGDASEGDRTQKRRELERAGVDVDALEVDFVSHQAVHTYLARYRDATRGGRDDSDDEQTATDRDRLRKLQRRVERVTADTVERAADADRIALGDADVLVDVRVFCADCGSEYAATELLARGGCDCEA
jgi:hypothetical protein